MGLTADFAEFLIHGRREGVDFDRTLTLGRQALMVSPRRLRHLLAKNGLLRDASGKTEFFRRFDEDPYYAEPFLEQLGARETASLDASGYEGATVTHDLNQPVPSDWRESYSVVIDGGTLEHVFNFPLALQSSMELVRPGGHLFIFTPANNYFGHGFYQFSPELFFRVLSESNGFTLERMVAFEMVTAVTTFHGYEYEWQRAGRWYGLRDPRLHGGRHELVNNVPVMLMIQAKKTGSTDILSEAPQQSDYAITWKTPSNQKSLAQSQVVTRHGGTGESVPLQVSRLLRGTLRRRLSPSTQRYLWLEALPRVLGPLDPLRYRRWARRFSFRNRRLYTPERR